MKLIICFVTFLSVVHLASAGVCGPATVDGVTFDLSGLVNAAPKPDHTLSETQGVDTYKYWFNLCSPVANDNMGCGTGASAFQKKTAPTQEACQKLSGLGEANLNWALLDKANPSAGVMLTVKGGDGCSGGISRQIQYNIKCNPSKTPGEPISIAEESTCHYVVQWESSFACSGGGLSGGWTFFLIVILGTVIYCAVGMIFKNQKQGLTGAEMVPNIDFWRALPGHVKDGNAYVFGKLCRRGENYQTVA